MLYTSIHNIEMVKSGMKQERAKLIVLLPHQAGPSCPSKDSVSWEQLGQGNLSSTKGKEKHGTGAFLLHVVPSKQEWAGIGDPGSSRSSPHLNHPESYSLPNAVLRQERVV